MDHIDIHDLTFSLLIDTETLQQRIAGMGAQINQAYTGKDPLILVVLNGAFMFAADLGRHLTVRPQWAFMKVSSYQGQQTRGDRQEVWWHQPEQFAGRHLLILEDIVDSGKTGDFLRTSLEAFRPASVQMATLLFKPAAFQGHQAPEYAGFEINETFVVGYGMDYLEKGRELPAIYQKIP